MSNAKREELSGRMLDFAVAVIKLTVKLPRTAVGRHVQGQLVRCGTSAGANYEEACGAESRADFIHKLSVVLKELKESRFWLRVIHRTGLIDNTVACPVLKECEELCAMIARSVLTTRTSGDV